MQALIDSLEAHWKIAKDKKKSAMKIATRDMTTAEVVDSPTPFAPPCVVIPHEQLTPEIIAPKAVDFNIRANRSDFCSAFDAESMITFGPTSYTKSARNTDAAIPMPKHKTERRGRAR